MATEVIMPQMGESIAEGTITKWYKKVGEHVERDEPLFEISTDKVDTEIPAPTSGVLTAIKVGEGETVPVDTVVAIIGGEEAGEAEPVEVEEAAEVAAPAPAHEPAPGTPEPDPVPMLPLPLGETSPAEGAAAVEPAGEMERLRSSPLVRRIAREHQIDLAQVSGTGQGGRITKTDIMSFIEKSAPAPGPAPAREPAPSIEEVAPEVPRPAAAPRPVPEVPTVPAVAAAEDPRALVTKVPMSVMRKSIAEHMISSRRTSAHVSTVFEADVTRIVFLREEYKDRFVKERESN